MTRLQHADLETLHQASRILGAPRTLDEFPVAAMRAAQVLIPAISYAYTAVDLDQHRAFGVMDPVDSGPTSELIAIMDTYVHQHPLISNFAQSADSGVRMISDFLSAREFHRLELYGDFYRLLDTEDQLAIQLRTASSHIVGLVANRDRRSFSERERLLFELLRPQLSQSYQNAMALSALDDMADAGRQQAVWLTSDGHRTHVTRGVETLFDRYFGPHRASGTGLPEALVDWLGGHRRRNQDGTAPVLKPLQVSGLEGRLTIRLVTGSASETDLLMLNEQPAAPPDHAFAALGLSRRQTEVVRWVVGGKTSAEIAEILGMKSRTVEKHLEHIFERLDVTSRASLVARALQSLDKR